MLFSSNSFKVKVLRATIRGLGTWHVKDLLCIGNGSLNKRELKQLQWQWQGEHQKHNRLNRKITPLHMQQTFWYIISLYHYIVKLYNPTVCGGHHENFLLHFLNSSISCILLKSDISVWKNRNIILCKWWFHCCCHCGC